MKIIKAVVGILRNENKEILITKRLKKQFMGGFWELPGGKIKVNESREQALTRELKEELGIQVKQLNLKQTMTYQYDDRIVNLSIYNVTQYKNTPTGIEGQKITWSSVNKLSNYKLLPTLKILVNALSLPNKYWITPASNHTSNEWLEKFTQKLRSGITLIQLRSKTMLDQEFISKLHNQCQQNNAKLLLNIPHKTFKETYCDGYHITTKEMLELSKRPCVNDKLFAVSAHNLDESMRSQKIGADFIVISPVQVTKTHPNTLPIGWNSANKVAQKLNIPVYFLGGMQLTDLNKALNASAQGIAGVSAF